jgi:hypothetical protein
MSNYKKFLQDGLIYSPLYDIFKNNNYDIVLIESVNCKNKDELKAREQNYINTLDKVVNIPNKTKLLEPLKVETIETIEKNESNEDIKNPKNIIILQSIIRKDI